VKRIGAERYWNLRAKQLEIALYEERKRSAHIARAGREDNSVIVLTKSGGR